MRAPDLTNSLYSNGIGTTRTLALWVQDAWRFAPMFKLTLGGRLEDWRASDGYNVNTTAQNSVTSSANGNILTSVSRSQPELQAARFSPKASLAFEPSRQWLLTASIGQAYRFPTVAELYQVVSASDQNLAIPNPNLRPENVLSEEIAVERRFVDGKVRLSLFNENVHDALIAQLTQLADGTGRTASFVTNVEAVRNTGIELAAQKNNVLIDGLETFGSVTYVDFADSAGSELRQHGRWNHGGGQTRAQHPGVAPDGRSDLPARTHTGRLPPRCATAASSSRRSTTPIRFATCSRPSILSRWSTCARNTGFRKPRRRISASTMWGMQNTRCFTRFPSEPL